MGTQGSTFRSPRSQQAAPTPHKPTRQPSHFKGPSRSLAGRGVRQGEGGRKAGNMTVMLFDYTNY